jgi:glycosyltransferase involved in cell wall biosynthesis
MHNRVVKIREFLKKNKIDILITSGGHLNYYGWRGKGDCKWIACEHGMFYCDTSLYIRLSKYLGIKKADKLVVLTKFDKKCFAHKWKKQANKVHVIGNYTETYYKKTESGNKTVIAVGRLVDIKQFDLLIKAWSLLQKDIHDWKLIILGEGPERENLESLIQNKKIKNVLLPGSKSNVTDYYKEADIFAMTSSAEGFGMVLLEAMAHSLPVVGFFSHGGVEELANTNNSILVEQGDVQGLADSLRLLIDHPELRDKMGKASYKSSFNYTQDKIINKWVTLFNEL